MADVIEHPDSAGQPSPSQSPVPVPPAYSWPQGQPVPPPRRKWRPWLVVAAAGWAVLLLVITYVSARDDVPTVREQHDIAQASPVVERAIAALVAAAGPDVVVELSTPRLEEGCELSLVWEGATLERDVTFRTRETDDRPLLSRIGLALPASYRATVRPATGTFRADAGEFVAIKGGVTDPGVVKLTASTGCRPSSPDFAVDDQPLTALPIDGEPARVLAALGVTDRDPVNRVTVPCSGNGSMHTARSVGRGALSASLDATLRPLAGADAVVLAEQPDRYAYRSGPLSVVVEAVDGEIRVTTTSVDCTG
ncbi:hypothetical protein GCM10027290_23300 [Micromonospora sonneratiae]|uniref:DUF2993 domain-containing protein n=1 Tax=Micromonospora sonneratiae TaxID=1184706 RepID=A0ABW3YJI4_9ACTN